MTLVKNCNTVIFLSLFTTLLACLVVLSCGPTKQATEARKITIGIDGKQFITADLYVSQSSAPRSALIIALAQNDQPPKWSAFGHKLAGMNYAVMILREARPAKDNSSVEVDSEQIIHSAIASLRSQTTAKIHKIAVMGVGLTGFSALYAAASDTSVAAVITLCPPGQSGFAEIDSALVKLPPRPLLVIASNKDPLAPAEESQKFYDSAKEPKKLVWLATEKHGTETLMAETEPIVRRVILMLLDRHLK